MRAKENFEVLKAEIYYTNHVKKAVYELHKLRTDKMETIAYFNKYLYYHLTNNFKLQANYNHKMYSDKAAEALGFDTDHQVQIMTLFKF